MPTSYFYMPMCQRHVNLPDGLPICANRNYHFYLKSKIEKNYKKRKFNTLFFNMALSIEIKYNIIFMYNTNTYDMHNYDINYNVGFFLNNNKE